MSDIKNKNRKKSNSPAQQEFISKENKITRFLIVYGLLIIFFILFAILSMAQPVFASLRNILNFLTQGSIIGLLALGLTNIIICGEFDISFAANATICSILSLILVGQFKLPLLLVYLIVFAIGTGISVLNGIFVVYVGMPSFIVTLGMSSILLGFSKWLTKGSVKMFPNLPIAFRFIGRTKIGGLFPTPLIVFLTIAFIVIVFLELTFKGRYFYAVGSNFEAASRVGISIKKIKFEAFILMGIIASSAGVVMGSLFGAGNPEMANSFLFPAIIATLLGASFLREGIPNVIGTVVAAMLMAMIANGFIMLGYPLWTKEAMEGVVLLIAVSAVSILKPGGIPPVKIRRT